MGIQGKASRVLVSLFQVPSQVSAQASRGFTSGDYLVAWAQAVEPSPGQRVSAASFGSQATLSQRSSELNIWPSLDNV